MQERLLLPVQPCRWWKCGKKFDTTLYYTEMDEICKVTISKRKYGLCDPYLQNSTHLCLICLASLPVYAILPIFAFQQGAVEENGAVAVEYRAVGGHLAASLHYRVVTKNAQVDE